MGQRNQAFTIDRFYLFGAHKSYSSLSEGSKHVANEGSARIATLRAGVPLAEAEWSALRYTERVGSKMREILDVVDVGEIGGVN